MKYIVQIEDDIRQFDDEWQAKTCFETQVVYLLGDSHDFKVEKRFSHIGFFEYREINVYVVAYGGRFMPYMRYLEYGESKGDLNG